MWLGTPGQLVRVDAGRGMGQVRVAGTGALLTVCLDLVEGVREGDWVLVHMGFAIGRIEEGAAREDRTDGGDDDGHSRP